MNRKNPAEPITYASCTYESPVGLLTLAAGDDGLKGLWIQGQKYFGAALGSQMAEAPNKHLDQARRWLDSYFAGERPAPTELALAPEGSEFRQVIWDLLCDIPYGQVSTYGELARKAARRLGKKTMSAQATGGAVGHNPVSIIIPCHRVVGADGSLTGYAGGISRKLELLHHEGVDCGGFYVPARSTAP